MKIPAFLGGPTKERVLEIQQFLDGNETLKANTMKIVGTSMGIDTTDPEISDNESWHVTQKVWKLLEKVANQEAIHGDHFSDEELASRIKKVAVENGKTSANEQLILK